MCIVISQQISIMVVCQYKVIWLTKILCVFALPPLCLAKAQVYEKVSLQGIQQLVHRSYQTLALWKLLCDHQFSLIMSELPKVNRCTNTSGAL